MNTDWFKIKQITNNTYSIDDNVMYLVMGDEIWVIDGSMVTTKFILERENKN